MEMIGTVSSIVSNNKMINLVFQNYQKIVDKKVKVKKNRHETC